MGSRKKNFSVLLATAAMNFNLSLISLCRSDLNFSLTSNSFGEYFLAARLIIYKIQMATMGERDFSKGLRTFITRLQISSSLEAFISFSFMLT